jgi:hypothetical protein
MKRPLSSPSHSFFGFYSSVRTPNADRLFYFCAPFGRRSHASKTHRHSRARLATYCSSRLLASVFGNDQAPRLWTGGFKSRGCTRIGPGHARDACDGLLYVSAHISAALRTAGRSTTICIRPLAIRRSLVPGRPFCHAAASRQARVYFDRPDQSSTRRYRRFPCFALAVLPLFCAKISLPGEAESALQACNRRGIPRPTAHQRCQAPEATVSGAILLLDQEPTLPPWPSGRLDLKLQTSSLCGW